MTKARNAAAILRALSALPDRVFLTRFGFLRQPPGQIPNLLRSTPLAFNPLIGTMNISP